MNTTRPCGLSGSVQQDIDPSSSGLSRRDVLRQALAAGASIALGSTTLANAQVASTPPSEPPFLPDTPAGETIEERAELLRYDVTAIFEFVRDQIHYEAYAGVLRGAQGTLWARAGNSVDQALLLSSLLDASMVLSRFAMGSLTNDQEVALTSSVAPDAETVRAVYHSALAGSLPMTTDPGDQDPGKLPDLSPDEQATVDLIMNEARTLQERAFAMADSTAGILRDVLADANVSLPTLTTASIPELERTEHFWVQVADGPEWTDFDPSLPDGTEPSIPTTSMQTLPDSLYHTVGVRLVAEEILNGRPTRRNVLEFQAPSPRLVNVPIAVAMTEAPVFAGTGIAINEMFTGTVSFLPCLMTTEEFFVAGTPLVFGAGEGAGLLGALGESSEGALEDGETVGVWLVVDVMSPGKAPVTVERAILDRIGPVARSANPETLTPATPVHITRDENGEQTIPELAGLTILTVDVARLPSGYGYQDAIGAELFGELHLLGPSVTVLANSLVSTYGLDAGFFAYPATPNVTSFSFALTDPANPDSPVDVTADLLVQDPAVVAVGTGASDSSDSFPFLAAGAFRQAAEHVLVEPMVDDPVTSPGAQALASVSTVFSAAIERGIPIIAITDPSSGIDESHSGEARMRMRDALEEGLVVVVPEQAVMLDDHLVSAWWLVDPATGHTWDQVEDGKGFAGGTHSRVHLALSPVGEQVPPVRNVISWRTRFVRLGRCLAVIAAAAVRASDYTGAGTVVGAGIETFKNLDPDGFKGCFG